MSDYRGISMDGFDGVMLEIRTKTIDELYAYVEGQIQQAEYDNRVFNEVTQEFDEVPLTEDQIKAMWIQMLMPPVFNPSVAGFMYWNLYKLVFDK